MENNIFYIEFGRKLRKLRRKVQLSQYELSKRISLSRTSVTNIEKGRQKIPLHVLYILASALGADPSELLPDREKLTNLSIMNEKLSKRLDKDFSINDEGKEWLTKVLRLKTKNQGDGDEITESGKRS